MGWESLRGSGMSMAQEKEPFHIWMGLFMKVGGRINFLMALDARETEKNISCTAAHGRMVVCMVGAGSSRRKSGKLCLLVIGKMGLKVVTEWSLWGKQNAQSKDSGERDTNMVNSYKPTIKDKVRA